MGRKTKKGLDYFSLDTKFSDSIKLCAYDAGGISICVLIELWQSVYSSHGYYMEFTDDHKCLFVNSSMSKISSDEFDKILNVFFKRNVFNKGMFDNYQILTSDAIQERYFEACSTSKRTNVLINGDYLLIPIDEKYKSSLIIENKLGINPDKLGNIPDKSGVNPEILGINDDKLGINTDKLGINDTQDDINPEESAQSKVKKSKEKESKVNEKITKFKDAFIENDFNGTLELYKDAKVKEKGINDALNDYCLNLITGEQNNIPYKYVYFKQWFLEYLKNNRQKYAYTPKLVITRIDPYMDREDLHSAFNFDYRMPDNESEIIQKIIAGVILPKDNKFYFNEFVESGRIEIEND